MIKAIRTIFLLASCSVVFSGCKQPEPPPKPPVVEPPPPDTFPATEISGTLINWSGGEAFITLTGGYSETVMEDLDEVELTSPLYQGSISADGAFSIELSAPDVSTLVPLGCTASDPNIAGLLFAVVSSVATPTATGEVLGVYGRGDPQTLGQQGIWLYVAEAYEAESTCTTTSQTGLSSIDLTLAPGWNQVIFSSTATGTVLTSGAVPDTFIWSEFF